VVNLTPYNPCRTGLHVCGFDPVTRRFLTAENLLLPEPGARHVWGAARGRLRGSVLDGPDFVVDLRISGRTIDSFLIERSRLGDLLVLAQNYTDWSKAPFHAE
jgi:hypothetical protein